MSRPRFQDLSDLGRIPRGAVLALLVGAGLALVTAALAERREGAAAELRGTEAARALLAAALDHRASHADACPTPSVLVADGALPRDAELTDAWGERLRVVCTGGHVRVRSAGPDGRAGTADDLILADAAR